jgi:hypothetical protein
VSPPDRDWGGGRRAVALAAPLGVLVLAAWWLRDFVAPGLPVEFDAHSHLARAGFVAEALREGRLPWWSFDWYGGWRLLEFHSPGWYLLVGAAALVLGDAVLATKVTLLAVQLAAVLGFYAFGRRLALAPAAAALAALLFLESPQRGWVLGQIGNHPCAIVYVGATAWLWLAAGSPRPSSAALPLAAARALVLAVMALGHPQAVLLLPGLLVFDATRLARTLGARRALAIELGALAGVAVLTACLWLPMWTDLALVSLGLDAGSRTALDARPLLTAAGFTREGFEYVFVRSHGAAWTLLGALAAGLALLRRDPLGVALVAALAASAATVVVFGERAVLGLGLFLWPLCARLPALVGRAESALTGALLAGVALHAALGERSGAHYAPASELGVYAALPATATHSRSFDVTQRSLCLDGFYGSSSAAPLVSRRAVAFGAFPQGAPLATNLGMALLARVQREAPLSEPALDALYLAHVGFLVDRGPSPAVVRLADASPALFAPHLEILAPTLAPPVADGELRLLAALRARWREDPLTATSLPPSLAMLARTGRKRDWEIVAPAVAAMEIDRSRASAARIFLDAPAPELGAPEEPAAGRRSALEVLEHVESGDRVAIAVHAASPGWLRLAYTHDPALAVRIDGGPVPFGRDSLGALVVALPAGRHAIEIRAAAPAPRLLLLVFCPALAGVLAWLGLRRGAVA